MRWRQETVIFEGGEDAMLRRTMHYDFVDTDTKICLPGKIPTTITISSANDNSPTGTGAACGNAYIKF